MYLTRYLKQFFFTSVGESEIKNESRLRPSPAKFIAEKPSVGTHHRQRLEIATRDVRVGIKYTLTMVPI